MKSGTSMTKLFMVSMACSMMFLSCTSEQKRVVIKPVETDSFLLNPGRGFTSTSEVYNENLGNRLHSLSGVSQQRFFWNVLEPEEGKIRFDLIDSAIARATRNGQQVNFRVMCQDVEMTLPDWAIKAGVKSPFYDDPVFIEKQINLIRALGKRYDGNPDLCFVDIGTIGQWGEWHIDPDAKDPGKIVFPSDENARIIIDEYLQSFKKTPLVALIAFKQKYGYGYATSKGTGWRADCWGDMDSLGWNHMRGVYPQAIEAAKANDSWKNGPIALETCWTMDEWFKRGWDIDYILQQALDWHATAVNNGNQSIPATWFEKVKVFEKKLGYRFVINELAYPATVNAGEKFKFDMHWQNKGVAPVYNPYNLCLQFVSGKDSTKKFIVKTDADVTQWMPGDIDYSSVINIPEHATPGNYQVKVALTEPASGKAAIQLAIEGKDIEGWYTLGEVNISN